MHNASYLMVVQFGALHIVQTIRISLPDIHASASHRFALGIKNTCAHKQGFTAGTVGNVLTGQVLGRFVNVKRSKHCGLGCTCGFGVLHGHCQHGKPQRVR